MAARKKKKRSKKTGRRKKARRRSTRRSSPRKKSTRRKKARRRSTRRDPRMIFAEASSQGVHARRRSGKRGYNTMPDEVILQHARKLKAHPRARRIYEKVLGVS